MIRPILLAFVAFVALGAVSFPLAGQDRADLLIRGGSVYDGTGGPPRRVDIAVTGDRITFVGQAPGSLTAIRTIDATGLVVAPGFIDPHTHTDGDLRDSSRRGLPGYLLQGVTTVVTGNDGGGPIGIGALRRQLEGGTGTNVVYLVGHGTVRRAVLGMEARAPSPVELDSMRSLVRTAMAEGAAGLSTGLFYAPGSFSETPEVVELAKVAAAAGGYYDSHLRDESSYTIGLLAAVDEAIRIGREAGIPVNIAHLKALGVDVWGKSGEVIERIRSARAAGQTVTADQYPYTASGSSVSASLLPRWAEAGGRNALLQRIATDSIRRRLMPEMAENLRRRGGPASLLLTSGKWKGRRLGEVATTLGVTPVEAAIEIIKSGNGSVASFNMNEADIDAFMKQDFVVTGSDGSGGHPRKFGTFPRKLRRYALDRNVIGFAAAIQASSSRTAAIVGLTDRGTIAVGKVADIVVLDSTVITDRSTYEAPEELATGVSYVLVNGQVAVDSGRQTGSLAGRVLTKKR